jgi:hypothetical protein
MTTLPHGWRLHKDHQCLNSIHSPSATMTRATARTSGQRRSIRLAGCKDIHIPHHISEVAPVEDRVSGTGHATNGTTTAVTGMGAVAAKRNYVSAAQVANAGLSAVLVILQDGSGGTTLAYIYCPAGQTVPVQYPSPLKTTAATGLYFQVIDSVPSPATTNPSMSRRRDTPSNGLSGQIQFSGFQQGRHLYLVANGPL